MQKCEPDINCKLTTSDDGEQMQKCEPDINCKLTMIEH